MKLTKSLLNKLKLLWPIRRLFQFCSCNYTHTRHQMWKIYLGWVSQSSSIRILIQSLHMHPETRGLQTNLSYTRYEELLKNPSLDVAKKWAETYSSSNSAAQYPKERVNYPGCSTSHREKSMVIMIFYRGLEYQNFTKYKRERGWT